jgi:pimeloyl-ACP methyl ester carboxylesterase
MKNIMDSWSSIVVTLAVFVGLMLSSQSALAGEGSERFLRIPVFFITDRNLQSAKSGDVDFGPHRKYIGDCKHDPFMGSAYCVVENIDNKPLTAHLKDLGWSKAEGADKVGDVKASPITEEDFEKVQNKFYGKIHEVALLTKDKNVFVFVHGYKNPFRGALSTAAKLAYNAERPTILYSWPSVAKLQSYTSDENNVEWSQEHFNDFVTQLEQVCTDDPSIKVRLFAHSMGTRLVVRAAPILREKSFVVEMSLICPDIDDGLVKHYVRRYLSAKGTTEIRLYMSRRDKALALSQIIHGGYTRLGEQADALEGMVTRALSGLSLVAAPKETSADDAEYSQRLDATKKRMQTIDFTSIDRGLLGHTVPAKLICNMSFNGTPGNGLRLVPEESGKRSKTSNLFTKMAKLKTAKSPAPTGVCLRVIKEQSVNTKQLVNASAQPAR